MTVIVLVVEDELLIRMAVVDLMEEAGFVTLEANNADEAIGLLEARDDIRVLFTDIDMPGSMDGLMLAAAVHNKWPPISIIVVSGQRRPDAQDMPVGSFFFSKPYPHEAIISTLRKLATQA
jgi:CheY-like chemotaxis protein